MSGLSRALYAMAVAFVAIPCLNRGGQSLAQPVARSGYCAAAFFYYGKGGPEPGHLDTMRTRLGSDRWRRPVKSQEELDEAIEKDRNLVVVTIEPKGEGISTVLFLRVSCREHPGRISRFKCEAESRVECLAEAVREKFPKALRDHDERCHRGRPCVVDSSDNVVPSSASSSARP
ncbi:MAG TPA: hypothetical protein VFA33_29790 [Bryobacteraceae bacterium]|nr:hypothetical protein [Bryobacteraceae bacterium]